MHPMPESWFDNADLNVGPVVAAYMFGLLMLVISYVQA
jgi:hypothetical protein